MEEDINQSRKDIPVFDMREQYSSEEGAIRVMKFFIGDEDDEFCDEVRVVIEDCDEVPLHGDSNGLTQILIDSGADTAVFSFKLDPCWSRCGSSRSTSSRCPRECDPYERTQRC